MGGPRRFVASLLSAHPDEIIFTSGGTEGNNLAITGVIASYKLQATSYKIKIPHIITTNIEHSSVLEVCRYLEKTKQARVTYVPVGANGIVDPKEIKKALKKETILVSVMYANNEIGTIQPIREIAKAIRNFRKSNVKGQMSKVAFPLFHIDACQAAQYLDLHVDRLGVDLMTINSGKMYGPKGVGALYVKRSTPIAPILMGGGQEHGLRSGTEAVPQICAFAKAFEIARGMSDSESKRLSALRDFLIGRLQKDFPRATINGDLGARLPNNVNVSFPDFDSELLVIELDAAGIALSSKSACEHDNPDESYVLRAIGATKKGEKTGSLRISMGRSTTKKDLTLLVSALQKIFKKYETVSKLGGSTSK